jgi:hypothetical protein
VKEKAFLSRKERVERDRVGGGGRILEGSDPHTKAAHARAGLRRAEREEIGCHPAFSFALDKDRSAAPSRPEKLQSHAPPSRLEASLIAQLRFL